jgi:hypothetical protein
MLAEASLLVALTVQHGSGADACLGADALSRSVEKRLQRRVFVDASRADLRFVVSFERRGAELEARIDVSDVGGRPRGSRSLVTAGHCSTLDDSLALSVALLVDQPPEPDPELEPQATPDAEPSSAGEPPTPPMSKPAPRPPTPITIPEDVNAPREPWHARLGLAGGASWGTLPGIRPGVALYVKLLPRQVYPILVGGEMLGNATADRDANSGARFRLLRAMVALCPSLHEGSIHAVSLCFGQKLGWLRVEGYGFDHGAREQRLTYALSVGAESTLRLVGPLAARGYLGAEIPVVRDRFASDGRAATELFRASPVALAAEIGVEAAVW